MSSYIECSKEWLRDVIKGKIEWRRCPDCLGRGYLWFGEEEVHPNQSLSEEQLEEECGQWGSTEFCENCGGLGYIELPM